MEIFIAPYLDFTRRLYDIQLILTGAPAVIAEEKTDVCVRMARDLKGRLTERAKIEHRSFTSLVTHACELYLAPLGGSKIGTGIAGGSGDGRV
jgi:hypothetical protein